VPDHSQRPARRLGSAASRDDDQRSCEPHRVVTGRSRLGWLAEARASGGEQALRSGPGAERGRSRRPGRRGDRACRRQRRRQVGADQDHRRHPRAGWRPDPLGRATRARPHAARCGGTRDPDRVPGPGAVRQPRHRAEHVPGPGTHDGRAARRGQHGDVGHRDTCRPLGDHGAFHSSTGRVALRRTTPSGCDREGGAVELEARDHGRADRGARRDPNGHGARPGAPPRRSRPGGPPRLPQPDRRLQGRRSARGAPARSHGRRRPGERVRPAAGGRLHDVRSHRAAPRRQADRGRTAG
jgi:hypothetical protein